MPKSKRRQRGKRPLPSASPNATSEAKQHMSLLTKITTTGAEDRAWALNSIARLVSVEPAVMSMVLQSDTTVKNIISCIFDNNIKVRLAAIGVLFNFLLVDDDAANAFIAADALTPLTAEIVNATEHTNMTQKFLELCLRVVSLIGSVQDRVGEFLSSSGSLAAIFELIQPSTGTPRSQLAALQVVESLDPSINQFESLFVANTKLIENYMTQANVSLRHRVTCLVIGIFQNVVKYENWPQVAEKALPLINTTLELDILHIGAIVNGIPQDVMAQDDVPPSLMNQLDDWKEGMGALVALLEILTNFVTTEGAPEEEFVQMTNSDALSPSQGGVSDGIVKLFVNANLLMKVLKLCSRPDEINSLTQIKFLKDYITSFTQVQSRALSCLSNILIGFPPKALGDLHGLVTFLHVLLDSNPHIDVMTSATDALRSLWGLMEVEPERSHIEFAAKLTTFQDETIKYYSENCVTLERVKSLIHPEPQRFRFWDFLAKQRSGEDIAPLISNALSPESPPWVLLEVVHNVFDLFDDYHDDLVKSLQILERLEALQGHFQNLLRENHESVEALNRFDECLINIGGFLEYKRGQS